MEEEWRVMLMKVAIINVTGTAAVLNFKSLTGHLFQRAVCTVKGKSIPFTGPIFGGLSEGKSVIIQGQIWAAVKSFAVNLVCLNGDIAFHFNPRFNEGRVVVCNTKEKGRWGSEERTFNMPFQPGVYFEMIVHVRSHCYQVSLNGNHFLEYRHRLPFHLVQNLQINGDVSVNCITFSGNNAPPPYAPPAYNVITPTVGYGGVILSNPAVPLHVAIPGNFNPSRKIIIVGNVPFLANRFHVNLKHSLTGNIALHINPRFKEGALVRNTQIHGSWGCEERHLAAMPLTPGCAFQMEIINLKHNYRVSINGFAVFDYTHRIPPGQVDQLEIAGDVTLSSVQY
ncbi:hypothetical protein JRQ81_011485 [Phrynocephalus forsythii]|uniref:Galectin n=1 Tax=Phrynocephalus forsythii TaxID=171643 RepID=A0A9Q0X966_9SAUR|nr:hypothetical protein JRQ81_011485 [Phrynocephalus forsythii]